MSWLIGRVREKLTIISKPISIEIKDWVLTDQDYFCHWYLLRRAGMSAAVIIRISTRQYDSKISQNINNNRRSTKSILYIIKY